MVTSTTSVIIRWMGGRPVYARRRFISSIPVTPGSSLVRQIVYMREMNKQGMNELRHRNRSEDDNTPMSPTLNKHPSYSSPDMQSCSDDTWPAPTNSQAQHSPFSAPNRTVFEVFPARGASMDQCYGSENNAATLTSAVPGSMGSIGNGASQLNSDLQQMKVKIDYKAKSQPIHTITHFGRDKTFIRCNGITINRFGELLVSDRYHNKIMCYDRTLRMCHAVGSSWAWLWSKDAYNNSFNWPSGLASDEDGHLFVADRYNHCIKEFAVRNVNLEFISKIGSVRGSEDGYFNEPRGLAISSKENKMYIADGCNNRIQVFQNRTYYSKFGCAGEGNGQFNIPCSIAISNDGSRLFVSDNRNNRVQIFKENGQFEQKVVHDQLSLPHGICITPDDHFIVSSSGRECVLVFKIMATNGPEHVATIRGKCEGVEHFRKPGDIVVTGSGHIVIASHTKIVFY